jgi:hypothetical protein
VRLNYCRNSKHTSAKIVQEEQAIVQANVQEEQAIVQAIVQERRKQLCKKFCRRSKQGHETKLRNPKRSRAQQHSRSRAAATLTVRATSSNTHSIQQQVHARQEERRQMNQNPGNAGEWRGRRPPDPIPNLGSAPRLGSEARPPDPIPNLGSARP